ncbi:MAG: hypothetical protein ACRERS_02905, partial [Methylococcales bacterium]
AIQLRISARRKYELYMARILLIGELADSGKSQHRIIVYPERLVIDIFQTLGATVVVPHIDTMRNNGSGRAVRPNGANPSPRSKGPGNEFQRQKCRDYYSTTGGKNRSYTRT